MGTLTIHVSGGSMAIRKQIKHEYVRHPFTKKKLLVIDTFAPNDSPVCPSCNAGIIKQIKIVESEYRGGIRYNVITCSSCSDPVWVVPT